jgi:hypothetical protein
MHHAPTHIAVWLCHQCCEEGLNHRMNYQEGESSVTGQWIFAIGTALLGMLIIHAGLRILRERTTRSVRLTAGQIKVDLITGFAATLIGIGYVVFGVMCLTPLGQLGLAAIQNSVVPTLSQLIVLPLFGFLGLFIFVVAVGFLSGVFTRRD